VKKAGLTAKWQMGGSQKLQKLDVFTSKHSKIEVQ